MRFNPTLTITVPDLKASTWLVAGIGLIVAAIVGGGFKVRELGEIPKIRSLRRQLLLGLLGLASLALGFVASQTEDFKIASRPVVVADPPTYTGKCPVTIRFSTSIRGGGDEGGTVQYEWVRPNGEASNLRDIKLKRHEVKGVSTTLKFTAQLVGSGTRQGLTYLRTVAPTEYISTPAPYSISCS
jgi:hypothetical protein